MSLRDRAENIKKYVKLLDVMADAGHLPRGEQGGDFQMKCPFHGQDNKPSAHVYTESFRCFTCHRSYDAIGYLAEVMNLSQRNAMVVLEKKYNVPKLKEEVYDTSEPEEKSKEFSLFDYFVSTEQVIVRNKFKYSRQNYAKMLFVLDDALKNNKMENMLKLREKL